MSDKDIALKIVPPVLKSFVPGQEYRKSAGLGFIEEPAVIVPQNESGATAIRNMSDKDIVLKIVPLVAPSFVPGQAYGNSAGLGFIEEPAGAAGIVGVLKNKDSFDIDPLVPFVAEQSGTARYTELD